MPDFPILTDDLARRLESLIAQGKAGAADEDQPRSVHVGRFGNTVALKSPSQEWRSGVYCFSGADAGRLDDILAFYADDGNLPPFYMTPMGLTGEAASALAAGYYQADFSQAILYGVPLETPPAPDRDGITVERVSDDETLEAYASVSVEGFEYPLPWREGIKADIRRRFRPGDTRRTLYVARCDSEPAGCADLTVREDVGGLGGAAVIPAFRGRGCQTALLRCRLHDAHLKGCRLISGGAMFGSVSFRNQQRAGLRLAYVESGWKPRDANRRAE